MTILNDYFNYKISEHFVSAIFNNDFYGLTDEEEKQFSNFMDNAGNVGFNNLQNATWYLENNAEPDFARCEITGLHSECYTMRLYFTNGSNSEPYFFPVTAINHDTNEKHNFYTLQDFIDYLNERDENHTFQKMEA